MRILLEAATESEWVAQHLETLGHEVIVADPNFTPMYGHRSRRIKTDRRDVAALADACHRGCYRAAHRRSAAQRTVQAQLNIRRELTDGSDAGDLARAGDHPRRRAFAFGAAAPGASSPGWRRWTSRRRSPRRSRRCGSVIEVLNEELATADETICDTRGRRTPSSPG